MPFGLWARVGSRNHVLYKVHVTIICATTIFREQDMPRHEWRHCCQLVKNGWTDRDAICVVDLGGSKETFVTWCPLAPPGEHDWAVCVWRRCGLMSSYFVHCCCCYCVMHMQRICLAWYILLPSVLYHNSWTCHQWTLGGVLRTLAFSHYRPFSKSIL